MDGSGRTRAWLATAGAIALLGGCAGKQEPAPAPTPPVGEAPPPEPIRPSPDPVAQDPPDPPLAPGEWLYAGDSGGSVARFGDSFSLRCDSARGRISLARAGSAAALRVRTSYGERALPAGAELAATDPLFDEMAFSRGRFTVEASGLPALVLPAWPEPARVVEDCR
jgi:hypothetical protein